jgi:molybdopterin-guanine dinucleotide biosynthesis protein A
MFHPLQDAFILAGGQSTRMGQDKALVPLAGKPLIQHALDLLRAAGLPARIAGARNDLNRYAPVIPDDTSGRGPLSGICTALRRTATDLALFLTIDLPLMPPSLLHYLIAHATLTGRAVTLPSISGFPQTFPAVIRRDALPLLETELEAGRGGCFAAFQAAGASIIPVEMIVQTGHVSDPRGLPPFRWFTNANTPAELKKLEALSRNLNLVHG